MCFAITKIMRDSPLRTENKMRNYEAVLSRQSPYTVVMINDSLSKNKLIRVYNVLLHAPQFDPHSPNHTSPAFIFSIRELWESNTFYARS